MSFTALRKFSLWSRSSINRLMGPGWSWRYTALAIGGSFLVVWCLRAIVLFHYPYPPSGDVGGDIYNARVWAGHPIPALAAQPPPPPLYYLIIVIPFTTIFPVFFGAQLYMVTVPALITIPGYFLVRESGVRPISAVFGATLLAMSAAFSLMITWNAAYNLFAILLLLFFLLFLSRAYRTQAHIDTILAGVMLALVGGTHELTFVVGIVAFVAVVVLRLVFLRGRRLLTAKVTGLISLVAVLAFIPFTYVYYLNSTSTVNVGVFDYWANLNAALQAAPYFAWGFQTPYNSFLSLMDIGMTFLAVGCCVRDAERLPFGLIVVGMIVGGLSVLVLDAGNAVRGLYFLPIPFSIAIPRFLEDFGQSKWWNKPWLHSKPELVSVSVHRKFSFHNSQHGDAPKALICCVAASFLVANGVYSLALFNQGIVYYTSITPAEIPVLNWLRDNTTPNSVIYDTTGIAPWVLAYSNRLAYGPVALDLEVTTGSYNAGLVSDLIDSGTYVTANDEFVVGNNFPGQVGLPEVFLQTSGVWVEALITQGNQIVVNAERNGSSESFYIGSGQLVGATSQLLANGVRSDFHLWFPSTGIGIDQSVTLIGDSAQVAWSSNDSQILNVTGTFGMPPSGYFLDYVSVPNVTNVTSVTETMSTGVQQFQVAIAASAISQESSQGSWVGISFVASSTLSFSVSGATGTADFSPCAVDASDLLHGLTANYVVTSSSSDYSLFLRAESGEMATSTFTPVFTSGGTTIFQVAFSAPDTVYEVGQLPFK